MKTNIKSTYLQLTPAIEAYVADKLNYLHKFLTGDQDAVRADVELAKITEHHKQGEVYRAEIHLHAAGQDLYSSETADNLFTAIDLVKDEMLKQLRTSNKKRLTLLRRGGRLIKKIIRRWYHK